LVACFNSRKTNSTTVTNDYGGDDDDDGNNNNNNPRPPLKRLLDGYNCETGTGHLSA
jgi:hypothetical protein